jgi:hypothetical protein
MHVLVHQPFILLVPWLGLGISIVCELSFQHNLNQTSSPVAVEAHLYSQTTL